MAQDHTQRTLSLLSGFKSIESETKINGKNLEIEHVFCVSKYAGRTKITLDKTSLEAVQKNADYLENKVKNGQVIYGVNTGFGGSADVRSPDIVAVQRGLVRHLNAGFGEIFSPDLPRGVMLVRANSLVRGMSGVRPEVVQLLVDMVNQDIIPQVPKRGSVSASGDLMPSSYIAAAMAGRNDSKVWHQGQLMFAPEALKIAGLTPVTFQSKEALAVVNSSSFASTLAANVVYEANVAFLLTQLATAMSVEALKGRLESFHPTIHQCMPHPGQVEVAQNIASLLEGSKMAITQLDLEREDFDGVLKQDRYALRTAAQWLGPVAETLQTTMARIMVDINSTNDNPVIDHMNDCVLHGGNFQGTAMTVSMDQTRQGLQLCGKLLFAQMAEIVNVNLNNGLPPNLAGSDITTDSGFKGMDTAMASYQAELDWLTNPLTNHVLAAELHNQAVNSMALVSGRKTVEALEILQMMLTNIILTQTQAIDLRFLQIQTESRLNELFDEFQVNRNIIHPKLWPWYEFAFSPEKTAERLVVAVDNGLDHKLFLSRVVDEMTAITNVLKNGEHVEQVLPMLGKGTSYLYKFVRQEVGVAFYDGQREPDNDLEQLLLAIKDHSINNLILKIFEDL